jgi:hypothetical protein
MTARQQAIFTLDELAAYFATTPLPRPKYLREWRAFTVGRSTPNF